MVREPDGLMAGRLVGDRPTRFGSRRWQADAGVSTILVAFLLVPLLAVSALAIDLGAARAWRRQSQNASDSGALAGAVISGGTGVTFATIRSEAAKVTARNLLVNQTLVPTAGATFESTGSCTGTIAIATPSSSTTTCYTATSNGKTVFVAVASPYNHNLLPSANSLSDSGLVWVRACKVQPNAIAVVINQRSLNMCTESVARNTAPVAGPTIFSASTSCPALTLKGTVHVVNQDGTQGGLVASLAKCSQGIDEQGGTLTAGYLEAPGGDGNVSGRASIHTLAGTVSGLAPDPYAWLPNPVSSKAAGTLNCDPDPSQAPGCAAAPAATTSGGVSTYRPGVYSGQLNLNAKTAVLKPGIYYLQGGLSMDAASKVTVPTGGVMFVNAGGTFQLDMSMSGSKIVSTSNNYPGSSLWPCTSPPTNCPRSQLSSGSVVNPDTGLATLNPWAEAPLTVYQPVTNNANMSFGSAPGAGMTWQGGVYLVPGAGNTAKIQLPSTNGMNVVLQDARLVASEIQWNDDNAIYTIVTPASVSGGASDLGLEN
jgi:Flp pilus assembly protein TadG